jgi:hypothetical protein
MFPVLLSTLVSLLVSVPAIAPSITPDRLCPDPFTEAAARITQTGAGLYSVQSYSVRAGGNIDLADCFEDHAGFVAARPDFSFSLTGMLDYERLSIWVESECDTVLLMRSPARQWFYDDDTKELNPALEVREPANGTYQIWIGTYGSSLCNATLKLETFLNWEG